MQRLTLVTLTLILAAVAALWATPASASGRASTAVRFALAQVGDRYRMGATGPNVWDCSSLVRAAWRRAGVRLPRTTYAQLRVGRRVARKNLRPGDLVFTSRGHVQIYVGRGRVVEAANQRAGVVKTRIWSFMTARRVG